MSNKYFGSSSVPSLIKREALKLWGCSNFHYLFNCSTAIVFSRRLWKILAQWIFAVGKFIGTCKEILQLESSFRDSRERASFVLVLIVPLWYYGLGFPIDVLGLNSKGKIFYITCSSTSRKSFFYQIFCKGPYSVSNTTCISSLFLCNTINKLFLS